MRDHHFNAGDCVSVKSKSSESVNIKKVGRVQRLRSSGVVDVMYTDGRIEEHVSRDRLELSNQTSNRSTATGTASVRVKQSRTSPDDEYEEKGPISHLENQRSIQRKSEDNSSVRRQPTSSAHMRRQQDSSALAAQTQKQVADIMEAITASDEDAVAVKNALSQLLRVIRSAPQSTAECIHDQNGEWLLLDTIQTHASHAVLLCYGCVLMRKLCQLSVKSVDLFVQHGIVPTVAHALHTFPDDTILQASACGCFAVLTQTSDVSKNEMLTMESPNILTLMRASLIVHREYSNLTRQVQLYACEVLTGLCSYGGLPTVASLLAFDTQQKTESIVELTVALLRQSMAREDRKVTCSFCSFLLCLVSLSSVVAANLRELKAIAEVSAVMEKYPADEGISRFSSAALREIAATSFDSFPCKAVHDKDRFVPDDRVYLSSTAPAKHEESRLSDRDRDTQAQSTRRKEASQRPRHKSTSVRPNTSSGTLMPSTLHSLDQFSHTYEKANNVSPVTSPAHLLDKSRSVPFKASRLPPPRSRDDHLRRAGEMKRRKRGNEQRDRLLIQTYGSIPPGLKSIRPSASSSAIGFATNNASGRCSPLKNNYMGTEDVTFTIPPPLSSIRSHDQLSVCHDTKTQLQSKSARLTPLVKKRIKFTNAVLPNFAAKRVDTADASAHSGNMRQQTAVVVTKLTDRGSRRKKDSRERKRERDSPQSLHHKNDPPLSCFRSLDVGNDTTSQEGISKATCPLHVQGNASDAAERESMAELREFGQQLLQQEARISSLLAQTSSKSSRPNRMTFSEKLHKMIAIAESSMYERSLAMAAREDAIVQTQSGITHWSCEGSVDNVIKFSSSRTPSLVADFKSDVSDISKKSSLGYKKARASTVNPKKEDKALEAVQISNLKLGTNPALARDDAQKSFSKETLNLHVDTHVDTLTGFEVSPVMKETEAQLEDSIQEDISATVVSAKAFYDEEEKEDEVSEHILVKQEESRNHEHKFDDTIPHGTTGKEVQLSKEIEVESPCQHDDELTKGTDESALSRNDSQEDMYDQDEYAFESEDSSVGSAMEKDDLSVEPFKEKRNDAVAGTLELEMVSGLVQAPDKTLLKDGEIVNVETDAAESRPKDIPGTSSDASDVNAFQNVTNTSTPSPILAHDTFASSIEWLGTKDDQNCNSAAQVENFELHFDSLRAKRNMASNIGQFVTSQITESLSTTIEQLPPLPFVTEREAELSQSLNELVAGAVEAVAQKIRDGDVVMALRPERPSSFDNLTNAKDLDTTPETSGADTDLVSVQMKNAIQESVNEMIALSLASTVQRLKLLEQQGQNLVLNDNVVVDENVSQGSLMQDKETTEYGEKIAKDVPALGFYVNQKVAFPLPSSVDRAVDSKSYESAGSELESTPVHLCSASRAEGSTIKVELSQSSTTKNVGLEDDRSDFGVLKNNAEKKLPIHIVNAIKRNIDGIVALSLEKVMHQLHSLQPMSNGGGARQLSSTTSDSIHSTNPRFDNIKPMSALSLLPARNSANENVLLTSGSHIIYRAMDIGSDKVSPVVTSLATLVVAQVVKQAVDAVWIGGLEAKVTATMENLLWGVKTAVHVNAANKYKPVLECNERDARENSRLLASQNVENDVDTATDNASVVALPEILDAVSTESEYADDVFEEEQTTESVAETTELIVKATDSAVLEVVKESAVYGEDKEMTQKPATEELSEVKAAVAQTVEAVSVAATSEVEITAATEHLLSAIETAVCAGADEEDTSVIESSAGKASEDQNQVASENVDDVVDTATGNASVVALTEIVDAVVTESEYEDDVIGVEQTTESIAETTESIVKAIDSVVLEVVKEAALYGKDKEMTQKSATEELSEVKAAVAQTVEAVSVAAASEAEVTAATDYLLSAIETAVYAGADEEDTSVIESIAGETREDQNQVASENVDDVVDTAFDDASVVALTEILDAVVTESEYADDVIGVKQTTESVAQTTESIVKAIDSVVLEVVKEAALYGKDKEMTQKSATDELSEVKAAVAQTVEAVSVAAASEAEVTAATEHLLSAIETAICAGADEEDTSVIGSSAGKASEDQNLVASENVDDVVDTATGNASVVALTEIVDAVVTESEYEDDVIGVVQTTESVAQTTESIVKAIDSVVLEVVKEAALYGKDKEMTQKSATDELSEVKAAVAQTVEAVSVAAASEAEVTAATEHLLSAIGTAICAGADVEDTSVIESIAGETREDQNQVASENVDDVVDTATGNASVVALTEILDAVVTESEYEDDVIGVVQTTESVAQTTESIVKAIDSVVLEVVKEAALYGKDKEMTQKSATEELSEVKAAVAQTVEAVSVAAASEAEVTAATEHLLSAIETAICAGADVEDTSVIESIAGETREDQNQVASENVDDVVDTATGNASVVALTEILDAVVTESEYADDVIGVVQTTESVAQTTESIVKAIDSVVLEVVKEAALYGKDKEMTQKSATEELSEVKAAVAQTVEAVSAAAASEAEVTAATEHLLSAIETAICAGADEEDTSVIESSAGKASEDQNQVASENVDDVVDTATENASVVALTEIVDAVVTESEYADDVIGVEQTTESIAETTESIVKAIDSVVLEVVKEAALYGKDKEMTQKSATEELSEVKAAVAQTVEAVSVAAASEAEVTAATDYLLSAIETAVYAGADEEDTSVIESIAGETREDQNQVASENVDDVVDTAFDDASVVALTEILDAVVTESEYADDVIGVKQTTESVAQTTESIVKAIDSVVLEVVKEAALYGKDKEMTQKSATDELSEVKAAVAQTVEAVSVAAASEAEVTAATEHLLSAIETAICAGADEEDTSVIGSSAGKASEDQNLVASENVDDVVDTATGNASVVALTEIVDAVVTESEYEDDVIGVVQTTESVAQTTESIVKAIDSVVLEVVKEAALYGKDKEMTQKPATEELSEVKAAVAQTVEAVSVAAASEAEVTAATEHLLNAIGTAICAGADVEDTSVIESIAGETREDQNQVASENVDDVVDTATGNASVVALTEILDAVVTESEYEDDVIGVVQTTESVAQTTESIVKAIDSVVLEVVKEAALYGKDKEMTQKSATEELSEVKAAVAQTVEAVSVAAASEAEVTAATEHLLSAIETAICAGADVEDTSVIESIAGETSDDQNQVASENVDDVVDTATGNASVVALTEIVDAVVTESEYEDDVIGVVQTTESVAQTTESIVKAIDSVVLEVVKEAALYGKDKEMTQKPATEELSEVKAAVAQTVEAVSVAAASEAEVTAATEHLLSAIGTAICAGADVEDTSVIESIAGETREDQNQVASENVDDVVDTATGNASVVALTEILDAVVTESEYEDDVIGVVQTTESVAQTTESIVKAIDSVVLEVVKEAALYGKDKEMTQKPATEELSEVKAAVAQTVEAVSVAAASEAEVTAATEHLLSAIETAICARADVEDTSVIESIAGETSDDQNQVASENVDDVVDTATGNASVVALTEILDAVVTESEYEDDVIGVVQTTESVAQTTESIVKAIDSVVLEVVKEAALYGKDKEMTQKPATEELSEVKAAVAQTVEAVSVAAASEAEVTAATEHLLSAIETAICAGADVEDTSVIESIAGETREDQNQVASENVDDVVDTATGNASVVALTEILDAVVTESEYEDDVIGVVQTTESVAQTTESIVKAIDSVVLEVVKEAALYGKDKEMTQKPATEELSEVKAAVAQTVEAVSVAAASEAEVTAATEHLLNAIETAICAGADVEDTSVIESIAGETSDDQNQVASENVDDVVDTTTENASVVALTEILDAVVTESEYADDVIGVEQTTESIAETTESIVKAIDSVVLEVVKEAALYGKDKEMTQKSATDELSEVKAAVAQTVEAVSVAAASEAEVTAATEHLLSAIETAICAGADEEDTSVIESIAGETSEDQNQVASENVNGVVETATDNAGVVSLPEILDAVVTESEYADDVIGVEQTTESIAETTESIVKAIDSVVLEVVKEAALYSEDKEMTQKPATEELSEVNAAVALTVEAVAVAAASEAEVTAATDYLLSAIETAICAGADEEETSVIESSAGETSEDRNQVASENVDDVVDTATGNASVIALTEILDAVVTESEYADDVIGVEQTTESIAETTESFVKAIDSVVLEVVKEAALYGKDKEMTQKSATDELSEVKAAVAQTVEAVSVAAASEAEVTAATENLLSAIETAVYAGADVEDTSVIESIAGETREDQNQVASENVDDVVDTATGNASVVALTEILDAVVTESEYEDDVIGVVQTTESVAQTTESIVKAIDSVVLEVVKEAALYGKDKEMTQKPATEELSEVKAAVAQTVEAVSVAAASEAEVTAATEHLLSAIETAICAGADVEDTSVIESIAGETSDDQNQVASENVDDVVDTTTENASVVALTEILDAVVTESEYEDDVIGVVQTTESVAQTTESIVKAIDSVVLEVVKEAALYGKDKEMTQKPATEELSEVKAAVAQTVEAVSVAAASEAEVTAATEHLLSAIETAICAGADVEDTSVIESIAGETREDQNQVASENVDDVVDTTTGNASVVALTEILDAVVTESEYEDDVIGVVQTTESVAQTTESIVKAIDSVVLEVVKEAALYGKDKEMTQKPATEELSEVKAAVAQTVEAVSVAAASEAEVTAATEHLLNAIETAICAGADVEDTSVIESIAGETSDDQNQVASENVDDVVDTTTENASVVALTEILDAVVTESEYADDVIGVEQTTESIAETTESIVKAIDSVVLEVVKEAALYGKDKEMTQKSATDELSEVKAAVAQTVEAVSVAAASEAEVTAATEHLLSAIETAICAGADEEDTSVIESIAGETSEDQNQVASENVNGVVETATDNAGVVSLPEILDAVVTESEYADDVIGVEQTTESIAETTESIVKAIDSVVLEVVKEAALYSEDKEMTQKPATEELSEVNAAVALTVEAVAVAAASEAEVTAATDYLLSAIETAICAGADEEETSVIESSAGETSEDQNQVASENVDDVVDTATGNASVIALTEILDAVVTESEYADDVIGVEQTTESIAETTESIVKAIDSVVLEVVKEAALYGKDKEMTQKSATEELSEVKAAVAQTVEAVSVAAASEAEVTAATENLLSAIKTAICAGADEEDTSVTESSAGKASEDQNQVASENVDDVVDTATENASVVALTEIVDAVVTESEYVDDVIGVEQTTESIAETTESIVKAIDSVVLEVVKEAALYGKDKEMTQKSATDELSEVKAAVAQTVEAVSAAAASEAEVTAATEHLLSAIETAICAGADEEDTSVIESSAGKASEDQNQVASENVDDVVDTATEIASVIALTEIVDAVVTESEYADDVIGVEQTTESIAETTESIVKAIDSVVLEVVKEAALYGKDKAMTQKPATNELSEVKAVVAQTVEAVSAAAASEAEVTAATDYLLSAIETAVYAGADEEATSVIESIAGETNEYQNQAASENVDDVVDTATDNASVIALTEIVDAVVTESEYADDVIGVEQTTESIAETTESIVKAIDSVVLEVVKEAALYGKDKEMTQKSATDELSEVKAAVAQTVEAVSVAAASEAEVTAATENLLSAIETAVCAGADEEATSAGETSEDQNQVASENVDDVVDTATENASVVALTRIVDAVVTESEYVDDVIGVEQTTESIAETTESIVKAIDSVVLEVVKEAALYGKDKEMTQKSATEELSEVKAAVAQTVEAVSVAAASEAEVTAATEHLLSAIETAVYAGADEEATSAGETSEDQNQVASENVDDVVDTATENASVVALTEIVDAVVTESEYADDVIGVEQTTESVAQTTESIVKAIDSVVLEVVKEAALYGKDKEMTQKSATEELSEVKAAVAQTVEAVSVAAASEAEVTAATEHLLSAIETAVYAGADEEATSAGETSEDQNQVASENVDDVVDTATENASVVALTEIVDAVVTESEYADDVIGVEQTTESVAETTESFVKAIDSVVLEVVKEAALYGKDKEMTQKSATDELSEVKAAVAQTVEAVSVAAASEAEVTAATDYLLSAIETAICAGADEEDTSVIESSAGKASEDQNQVASENVDDVVDTATENASAVALTEIVDAVVTESEYADDVIGVEQTTESNAETTESIVKAIDSVVLEVVKEAALYGKDKEMTQKSATDELSEVKAAVAQTVEAVSVAAASEAEVTAATDYLLSAIETAVYAGADEEATSVIESIAGETSEDQNQAASENVDDVVDTATENASVVALTEILDAVVTESEYADDVIGVEQITESIAETTESIVKAIDSVVLEVVKEAALYGKDKEMTQKSATEELSEVKAAVAQTVEAVSVAAASEAEVTAATENLLSAIETAVYAGADEEATSVIESIAGETSEDQNQAASENVDDVVDTATENASVVALTEILDAVVTESEYADDVIGVEQITESIAETTESIVKAIDSVVLEVVKEAALYGKDKEMTQKSATEELSEVKAAVAQTVEAVSVAAASEAEVTAATENLLSAIETAICAGADEEDTSVIESSAGKASEDQNQVASENVDDVVDTATENASVVALTEIVDAVVTESEYADDVIGVEQTTESIAETTESIVKAIDSVVLEVVKEAALYGKDKEMTQKSATEELSEVKAAVAQTVEAVSAAAASEAEVTAATEKLLSAIETAVYAGADEEDTSVKESSAGETSEDQNQVASENVDDVVDTATENASVVALTEILDAVVTESEYADDVIGVEQTTESIAETTESIVKAIDSVVLEVVKEAALYGKDKEMTQKSATEELSEVKAAVAQTVEAVSAAAASEADVTAATEHLLSAIETAVYAGADEEDTSVIESSAGKASEDQNQVASENVDDVVDTATDDANVVALTEIVDAVVTESEYADDVIGVEQTTESVAQTTESIVKAIDSVVLEVVKEAALYGKDKEMTQKSATEELSEVKAAVAQTVEAVSVAAASEAEVTAATEHLLSAIETAVYAGADEEATSVIESIAGETSEDQIQVASENVDDVVDTATDDASVVALTENLDALVTESEYEE